MIDTKVKKRNSLLMLILALIMVLGTISIMYGREVKAAPPAISIGHNKGSFRLTTSGDTRSILQMNLTQEAMSDLRQIYGANAMFLTDGGIYQPQTSDIYMDGKIAFVRIPLC